MFTVTFILLLTQPAQSLHIAPGMANQVQEATRNVLTSDTLSWLDNAVKNSYEQSLQGRLQAAIAHMSTRSATMNHIAEDAKLLPKPEPALRPSPIDYSAILSNSAPRDVEAIPGVEAPADPLPASNIPDLGSVASILGGVSQALNNRPGASPKAPQAPPSESAPEVATAAAAAN
eukprot:gnl/MRDRNA2_/MRDRNA2_140337_c0_seq1.p1 gnl/MRDRNA2_/MRDRNA2_140337_c0~~gnl/MRDRNA2_/MRDRNA2_140337_c0_seq1.p1  ORF type:complete len:175 (+),score=30.30 gnl/MRDRNA2_/MRDRNA2_140337_c0_seq1:68-592(+)